MKLEQNDQFQVKIIIVSFISFFLHYLDNSNVYRIRLYSEP
jgi:hypothetical protein